MFAARGYEASTVDAIARRAGVSRRTFFRYFSSKEDVVVGTSDALAEDVLAAFAARPPSEPPMADPAGPRPVVGSRLADANEARAIVRLLRESRTLRRAMLERHARLEERLAVLIAGRTGADRARTRRRRSSRSSPGPSWTRRSTSGSTSARRTPGPWSTTCSGGCGQRSRRAPDRGRTDGAIGSSPQGGESGLSAAHAGRHWRVVIPADCRTRATLSLVLLGALSGCGSGGTTGATPNPTPPPSPPPPVRLRPSPRSRRPGRPTTAAPRPASPRSRPTRAPSRSARWP